MQHRNLAEWMTAYMADRGLDGLSVALEAGFSSNGLISQVMRGERPLPLKRVIAVAKALKVKGEDRETFFLLANLSHSPRVVQERMWSLIDRDIEREKEKERMKESVAMLAKRLQVLEAETGRRQKT